LKILYLSLFPETNNCNEIANLEYFIDSTYYYGISDLFSYRLFSNHESMVDTLRTVFKCEKDSGVTCPDFTKVATAYGIATTRIINHTDIEYIIKSALDYEGPMLIEVMIDHFQPFHPRVMTEKKPDGKLVSKPLEDMYPFLDRELFKNQMIVEPVNE